MARGCNCDGALLQLQSRAAAAAVKTQPSDPAGRISRPADPAGRLVIVLEPAGRLIRPAGL
jgi:hypothetical protein